MKWKPIFLDALGDGTLAVVEKTLEDALHLKFEMREHAQLKRLRFKLKEREEISKKLKAMQTHKDLEGDLSQMESLIERSAYIDYSNPDLDRVKLMYAQAKEREQTKHSLEQAVAGYVDIE